MIFQAVATIWCCALFDCAQFAFPILRDSSNDLIQGRSELRADGDAGSDVDVSLPNIPNTARPDALEMSSASSGAVHSPAPLLRKLHHLCVQSQAFLTH